MAKYKNIEGEKFGKLLVIEYTEKRSRGSVVWKCLCDCGKVVEIRGNSLATGNTTSCGCILIKDLTGVRYGRLTAIKLSGKKRGSNHIWLCKCDCGNTTEISSSDWGIIKSCGCFRKDRMINMNYIHGQYGTKEHISYLSNKRRAEKQKRTPAWADLEAIRLFYSKRPEGTHVDHDIPLQGKVVSGFHILENLKYMEGKENIAKGNKFIPYSICKGIKEYLYEN